MGNMEQMKQKVYDINAFKDPLCTFLFSKWKIYFGILFLFFFLQILASLFSRSYWDIDVNSLPYEKAVLPTLKDPAFYIYHGVGALLFFLVKRFFLHISQAFKTLFKNKIFRKKGESPEEGILDSYNELLKEFENSMNG